MLANIDDMKEALDKAAISTDQAVRNMAIRYREMRNEFDQLDAFFTIYKQGVELNGTAVRATLRGRTPAAKAVLIPSSTPRTSNKADNFSASMQAILLEIGRPMKLNEVYTTYQQRHADDQIPIETFRQRLVKRRDTIVLIKGQGYWWGGAELPAEQPVENV